MILEWKKSYIELIDLYVHPKNSNHLRSHLRAVMAVDHSRLGLENKSGRIFCVPKVYFTKSCQQIWVRLNQPFILLIIYTSHLRWNSIMRRCFQTKCRISQFFNTNCTHSIFRTTEPSKHAWAFSETVQKIFEITYTASRISLLTSAKFLVNIKRVTLQNNREFTVFIFFI